MLIFLNQQNIFKKSAFFFINMFLISEINLKFHNFPSWFEKINFFWPYLACIWINLYSLLDTAWNFKSSWYLVSAYICRIFLWWSLLYRLVVLCKQVLINFDFSVNFLIINQRFFKVKSTFKNLQISKAYFSGYKRLSCWIFLCYNLKYI